MKVSEIKHNHSLTNLLKIVIFSILMLLPFLSIGTRCLYVICNKNAYQSYSENEQVNRETLYLNTNQTYTFKYFNNTTGSTNNTTPYIYTINVNLEIDVVYDKIRLTDANYIYFYDSGNNLVYRYENFNDVKLSVTNNVTLQTQPWFKSYLVTYENGNLDNVFDYSVDQMTNSPTFNWTQNTALYTGVKGMTDNLQVQTNLIAVLIVYWTILTIIYIILDIVLKCFEWLTHGLIKKS